MPATLATHDYHNHGRLSHIITARVEGIPASSGILSLFGSKRETPQPQLEGRIPCKADFEAVIARSDKLASDLAAGRKIASPPGSPILPASDLPSDSAIVLGGEGGGSPKLKGLYTRRQSSDMQRPNMGAGAADMARSGSGHGSVDTDRWSTGTGSGDGRSERAGWLKGDLCASRFLLVHANPSPTGDVTRLDLRKEGFVNGLNSWRFTALSDVVSLPPPQSCGSQKWMVLMRLVLSIGNRRSHYQLSYAFTKMYTLLLSIGPHSELLAVFTTNTK